jgi:hypothetical protein
MREDVKKVLAELEKAYDLKFPRQQLYSLSSYTPPGPVCAAYIYSAGPVDIISGPGGSGKTIGSIFKIIRYAAQVAPVCKDGRIRVAGVGVKDNYRTLYRTMLRSWLHFFPLDKYPEFSGGQDRPAKHVIKLSTIRKTNVPPEFAGKELPIDISMDFFALGDQTVEEALKGYEPSIGWLNEGDTISPRAIPFLYSRTGRYPPLDDIHEYHKPYEGVPRMVCVDFNPTDIDHPLWAACQKGTFQENLPEGAKRMVNFFHQPSGLSPEGENRKGKSLQSYQEDAASMTENDVQRFVHGLPAFAQDGKPVYGAEFDLRTHVAQEPLKPVPNIPLNIGFDQGLRPAAIFFQDLPSGQVRIYDELAPEGGTGIERFVRMVLYVMETRFKGLPKGRYYSDPAGFYGADTANSDLSWATALGFALGNPVEPAPSQEPLVRQEAVRHALNYKIDAKTAGLIIDPCCKMLIAGFAAHYKYRRIKSGQGDRFEDRPEKNKYSNPHDALQYGLLGVRGVSSVVNLAARGGRGNYFEPPNQQGNSLNFDVHSLWT